MAQQETLNKIQSIASIVSSVAIPIVIALVGWWVQSSISTEGIKKDYVQMAIGILKESDTQKDEEMRKWAVAVLNENSPIPFSKDLREKLETGHIYVRTPFPEFPETFMKPPQELIIPDVSKKPPITDLVAVLLEDYSRGMRNTEQLKSLQRLIFEYKKLDEKYRSAVKKPQS